MDRETNDSNNKKPSMIPWVIIAIISFIGMMATGSANDMDGFSIFFGGLSIACIGIIVVFWIRVAKAAKRAVNKATGFVYDVGATVHTVKTNSINKGPYDLLDFTKGYSNIEYVTRVRIVPALASYFCKDALIDIRKNTNEMDEYSSYLLNTLNKNGADSTNANTYFKEVIDLVYSRSVSDYELRSRLFSFLSENCTKEDYVNIIIPTTLNLTKSINGYFCATLTIFFKALGLSNNEITEGFVNGGYKETVMDFPAKTKYTIADYKDLFDFTDSPIDLLYSTNGAYNHMNYCRVVPIVSYLSSKCGGFDLLGSDRVAIENYIQALKNRENQFLNESIDIFVNETFHQCSLLSENEESELTSKVAEYLATLNTAVLRDIIQNIYHLLQHINNMSCTFIYEVTNHKISVFEINECIKDAGFESFEFTPLIIEETKDDSHYFSILGLNPGASLEEIKAAYRKLSMDFHPDKLVGKDLNEEFIYFAEKRFQEIKEAYEFLKEKLKSSDASNTTPTTTFSNIYGLYESDSCFAAFIMNSALQQAERQPSEEEKKYAMRLLNKSTLSFEFNNKGRVKVKMVMPDLESDDWENKTKETNTIVSYRYNEKDRTFETESWEDDKEIGDRGVFSEDYSTATLFASDAIGEIKLYRTS
ncbi:MAG: J domain-containing protein [Candidatus Ornithospirochaeta sp.]